MKVEIVAMRFCEKSRRANCCREDHLIRWATWQAPLCSSSVGSRVTQEPTPVRAAPLSRISSTIDDVGHKRDAVFSELLAEFTNFFALIFKLRKIKLGQVFWQTNFFMDAWIFRSGCATSHASYCHAAIINSPKRRLWMSSFQTLKLAYTHQLEMFTCSFLFGLRLHNFRKQFSE